MDVAGKDGTSPGVGNPGPLGPDVSRTE
jgi:hypothetical protein